MPRLDYRASPANVLPGTESQILLEVLVAEVNRVRDVLHQPPISDADVQRALREAVRRRHVSPAGEDAPCS